MKNMKNTITLLSVIFIMLYLSLQVKGNCIINNEELPPGRHIRNCKTYTCHPSGDISVLACPQFACKEQIGYKETDLSKPYPECCAGPICRESYK